jgi:hypothetical protein
VVLFLLFPLFACAKPFEGRVATRLAEAGLSRPMAECMADRWVNRLSLAQLQKIGKLSDDLKKERGRGSLTVGRFLERVRAVDDPEIFTVVSGSAAACALSG